MKLQCEVLSVDCNGESLTVDLQGKSETDADWRPMTRQTVQVPYTARNAKAFYIGRKVEITVKVK